MTPSTRTGARKDAGAAATSPDTRQRIIEVAERLFAERGFDGTSTTRLASAAEVPQGLVFYYFKTKLDLLLAIVRERPQPRAVFDRAEPVGRDVRTLLDFAAERLAAELDRHRYTRAIVFREAHQHDEIARRGAELIAEATRAMADLLGTGDDLTAAPEAVAAAAGFLATRLLVDATLLGREPAATAADYRTDLDLLAAALTMETAAARQRSALPTTSRRSPG